MGTGFQADKGEKTGKQSLLLHVRGFGNRPAFYFLPADIQEFIDQIPEHGPGQCAEVLVFLQSLQQAVHSGQGPE